MVRSNGAAFIRFWVPELSDASQPGGSASAPSDKAIFDPVLHDKEKANAKKMLEKKNAGKNFFKTPAEKAKESAGAGGSENKNENAYPQPIVVHKVVSQQTPTPFGIGQGVESSIISSASNRQKVINQHVQQPRSQTPQDHLTFSNKVGSTINSAAQKQQQQ